MPECESFSVHTHEIPGVPGTQHYIRMGERLFIRVSGRWCEVVTGVEEPQPVETGLLGCLEAVVHILGTIQTVEG